MDLFKPKTNIQYQLNKFVFTCHREMITYLYLQRYYNYVVKNIFMVFAVARRVSATPLPRGRCFVKTVNFSEFRRLLFVLKGVQIISEITFSVISTSVFTIGTSKPQSRKTGYKPS